MKKTFLSLVFIACLLTCTSALAENSTVYEITTNKSMTQTYAGMKISFDKSQIYIFYEMNIGNNLAFFSEK